MRNVCLVAILAPLLWALPAKAQEDFVGARALGMGEAMRATASGGQAAILDPSAIALQRQYAIEVMYGIKAETLGHELLVSIVDSVTSRLAAGLYYEYINSQPKLGFNWAGGRIERGQLHREGHVASLSLAVPLGRFILGSNIKYVNIDVNGDLPKGTSPSTLEFDSVNGVTFDVSLLLQASSKFNVAVIGYNLWDHGSRETPLSLGMALGFVPSQIVVINFDAVLNFTGYKSLNVDNTVTPAKTSQGGKTTGRMGLGTEIFLGRKVPLRFGAVYDTALTSTYLTGGIGYMSTMFGVDLGYRGKVQGGVENMAMVGLRFFVN